MIQRPSGYVDKTDWAWLAQPVPLSKVSVHRWFVFPHSYSHILVERIIEAWDLTPDDRILDPFVGAGTTILVAKDHGIPAVGLDVSPLAILASRVKAGDYRAEELTVAWRSVLARIPKVPPEAPPHELALLRRAFTPRAWSWLAALREVIVSISRRQHREFFQLAYLRGMREVCRARSDGGWIRWTRRRPSGDDLIDRTGRIVAAMIDDVRTRSEPARPRGKWEVVLGDARRPPKNLGRVSAVICSPPYPNRHDYSRVFAPELLLTFCNGDGLKELRYRSFRSHVEAKEPGLPMNGYSPPSRLARTLRRLVKAPVTDRRVLPMVDGYFRDCFLMLHALGPHLQEGARLAFVVGNVRHAGIMVEVDEHLAEIAQDLGYHHEESWVIRYRGNSAQQMGKFGRMPARESIVFLRWVRS